MLGASPILGVYDHPPPSAAIALGVTYRPIGNSRANFFLEQTTQQATKWLIWASKLTGPILP